MPQGMSREREGLLRLYGAKVEITESMGGMNEAVEAAQRIAAERAATPSSPTSSPTPPTPRSTAAPPRRRSGATWTARSTCWWPAWAPAAPITGAGERLKERNPDLHVVAVEPASSPVLSGGQPGPAQDPGDRRRASCPPVLQPRRGRRDPPGGRRGRDRDRARLRSRREGVLAGISCGAALWAAIEVGLAARDARQADRGRHARLRRALREHALLRPRLTMLGLGTLTRVARELRADLTAAQERDPAARDVGPRRDPAHLRRRAGAAGPPRRARAARGRRAARPAAAGQRHARR